MADFKFSSTYPSYLTDFTNLDLTGLLNVKLTTASEGYIAWSKDTASLNFQFDLLGWNFATTVVRGKLTDLAAGKVQGLDFVLSEAGVDGGTNQTSVRGLNLSAVKLFDFMVAEDWTSFNAYILKGDDRMIGSDQHDLIMGGAGADTISGGQRDDTLSGGKGDDLLTGGSGADELNGGLGFDILTGGPGADRFAMTVGLTVTGFTTIDDFQHGTDQIMLARSGFAGLGAKGDLDAALFTGGAVTTADQLILYDPATGYISYRMSPDPDSSSWTFAVVDAGTVLTAGDFLII
ncbi:MAG: hypothetical protein H7245_01095 [Candidatus Saccharibacteria bacterium]|nr:hypothetical protein [Pseudorhodobacter sp.]